MAASVSPWTKKGTNTNVGTNANGNFNNGDDLINNVVRYECHVWLEGTSKINSEHFDFPVTGAFTVVLNAAQEAIVADAGDVDVDIEGSVTGDSDHYVKMADLLTWNAGGASETDVIGYAVYNYDDDGRMPYMRISLTCQSNADSSTKGVKVVVIPN